MKSKLLLLTFLFIALQCQAQQTDKNKKVIQLMALLGNGNIGVVACNAVIGEFKKIYTDVPASFWDKFAKKVKGEDLVKLIIPIYEKHYSESEIDQLIVFYQSPIGKKVIADMPKIMQESMKVGEVWGGDLAKEVLADIKKEGYSKE